MRRTTCQCQVAEVGPHFIPCYLPFFCIPHWSCSHRCCAHNFPISIARWENIPGGPTRIQALGGIITMLVWMVVKRSLGVKKNSRWPPVQLSNLSTVDRNLTGGRTQSDIISFAQLEKESGE